MERKWHKKWWHFITLQKASWPEWGHVQERSILMVWPAGIPLTWTKTWTWNKHVQCWHSSRQSPRSGGFFYSVMEIINIKYREIFHAALMQWPESCLKTKLDIHDMGQVFHHGNALLVGFILSTTFTISHLLKAYLKKNPYIRKTFSLNMPKSPNIQFLQGIIFDTWVCVPCTPCPGPGIHEIGPKWPKSRTGPPSPILLTIQAKMRQNAFKKVKNSQKWAKFRPKPPIMAQNSGQNRLIMPPRPSKVAQISLECPKIGSKCPK